MLYRNQTQSWIMSTLAGALISYLAIESGHVVVGVIWWFIFFLINMLRVWNTSRFFKASAKQEITDYCPWFARFFLYTFLAGLAWCAGAIVIGKDLDQLYQVYVLIVVIGVGAAAIPLLGVVHRVLLAFQVPTTIPYLIYLAVIFGDRGTFLIFMFALYLIGVTYAIHRMDKNLSESLVLQYEKEQLANSLTESNQELLHENEKLETLTLEDELTGVHNRRYFEMQLEAEWKRLSGRNKILTLMVIDIDYFKLYNDTYGHAEGDVCLRNVARILKTALQSETDFISRIGGEEFVALLPGVDESRATSLAEHMDRKLQKAKLTHATSPLGDYVTVSIGIASVIPGQSSTALSLFKAADKALYSAKARGRNQVVVGEMEMLES